MGYVEANGLRLHYARTGGDKPPVVLAHGYADDGLCWTPVAADLAADYDVVMVDARGHGRSDGPEHGFGLTHLVGDLAGVIDGLGLERPAVLGHSLGAATALLLAGTYPEVPRAILLEDPPSWWVAPPGADHGASWYGRLVALKRKTRDELIAGRRQQDPHWSEAELAPWAESKLRVSFYVLNWGDMASLEWADALQAIVCHVLLITADPERGAIVTAESAAALSEAVAMVEVADIPGAGHNIRRDRFARYIEVVRAFLEWTVG
jgi:pimeloyl-ACP methyl ester carboxylesterase